MEFIRKQYALAAAYTKTYLLRKTLVCLAAFLLIAALSALLFEPFADVFAEMIQSFIEEVESSGLVDDAGNISIVTLFGHNVTAAGTAAMAGLIPFVFLPILSLALNAVLVGAMIGMAAAVGQNVGTMILCGLLPHGIFEIPALMLGMAIGIRLCASLSAAIRKKPGAPRLEHTLQNLFRVFVCYVLPLLAAAAVIEATITPRLIQMAG